MSIKRNSTIALFLFAGLLSLLILPGCARHRDVDQNQMQMGQGSIGSGPMARTDQVPPTVSQVPQRPGIIVQSGRDYYVDSRGALHQIVRHEVMSGGGLYYIEGDDRPYYIDESGRLYYREPAGRILYYEDVSPRETVVVPSQPMYRSVPVMSPESCESQYQECMAGCRGISPRQTYDRPNCMNNCDTIRSGCLGR